MRLYEGPINLKGARVTPKAQMVISAVFFETILPIPLMNFQFVSIQLERLYKHLPSKCFFSNFT